MWGLLGPFLSSPPGLIALAGVVLLGTVGLVFAMGWPWWVWLMILFVLLVALLGVLLVWRWRSKRQDALQAERAAAEEERHRTGELLADQQNLEELRAKWREALRTLRDSQFQRRGEDPIYALPWFLVLGERGSGKTSAIRAAQPPSSLAVAPTAQGPYGTRNCDWWFFDGAVLLDTAGRYAFPSEEADEGEWRELLSLLKHDRWQEPINGVVVTLAADALASRPEEKLREEAGQLRRRVDELARHLGAKFPIYFLVTKSDQIAGFSEFFSSLPEPVLGQAMGCMNADPEDKAGPSDFLEQGFQSITQPLIPMRLALMEEDRPSSSRAVFLFPEEFKTLRRPLRAFVEAFFRQSPFQETPFFRGLFFTSGRQEGSPASRLSQPLGFEDWVEAPEPRRKSRGYFLRDIFSVILPQDRPLTHRTASWRERYRLTQVAALVATLALSLLLSVLLTLSFIHNRRVLSRLDVEACLDSRGPVSEVSLAQHLKEMDECREKIEGLIPRSLWGRLAQGFGLRQIRKLEDPLRRRYLQAFRSRVLLPLDARIDQKLIPPGPESPPQVRALLQRIHLLGRCRDRGGCPGPEEWTRPDYRVMLTAESPGVKGEDPMVGQLMRTHEAYLRWQTDPRAFGEMRARHLERLRRWLSAGGLRAEWIVASANPPAAPLRYRDFWRGDLGGQVDPPYTRQAWENAIWPLLAALQELAPEMKEVAEARRELELGYRREGLRQWEQFLAAFSKGEESARTRSQRRQLASRLLAPDSPYRRILEAASSTLNLSPFLGSTVQDGDIPAWAVMFRRYTALKARAAEAQGLGKKDPNALKARYGEGERKAFEYLTRYWEAFDQLPGEVGDPPKSFKSAQKAFEEGEPSDRAVHPIQKAAWNVRRMREAIGFPHGEDRIFWILLVRPPELTWRVILDEAGVYLQEQWEKLLWKVKPLSPEEGWREVVAFVTGTGPAAAFLDMHKGRYVRKRLVDEELSFTDSFLSYLSRPPVKSPSPESVKLPQPGPGELPGNAAPAAPASLDLPEQIIATSP